MQAIAEAVALGQKAGLNRDRLFDVLSHTAVIAPAYIGKLARAAANDYSPQFAMRLMNKDFGLILKMAAELRVPMPATAAVFQINTAEAAESNEEDFLAVIRLAENLARVNTHQNGRDNLQSSKLEIRNSKQIQMTKHKENSKRASLDAVFLDFVSWRLWREDVHMVDRCEWRLGIHHRWLRLGSRSTQHIGRSGPVATNNSESYSGRHRSYERGHGPIA